MPRLFATVARVAQARARHVGRRAVTRGALIAACALAALLTLAFALAAATVALSQEVGPIAALAIMAAGSMALLLILLGILALEARRHRRLAVRRADLDRQLMRAAALSMVPDRAPSRPVIGLGLVALGALLVLVRRTGDDD